MILYHRKQSIHGSQCNVMTPLQSWTILNSLPLTKLVFGLFHIKHTLLFSQRVKIQLLPVHSKHMVLWPSGCTKLRSKILEHGIIIIVGVFIPVSSLKVFGHSIHSERRRIYPGKSIQALQNEHHYHIMGIQFQGHPANSAVAYL